MKKYILFIDGVLSARYDSSIHGERIIEQQNQEFSAVSSLDGPSIFIDNPDCKIPSEAIEVSDEVFSKTISEQDGIWSLVDEGVVKLPFPAPTIDSLISDKRNEINIIFEQAMRQIVGSYPANEVSSWSKQESEARAYLGNNNAATPLIDALASSRSVDKADLVGRIIAKADLFADISGSLIGRRQALEDAIDALPETATAEDIAEIAW